MADVNLADVLNPVTGWPPTTQPNAAASIALYRAAALGDDMGINDAYTALVNRWDENTLPGLTHRSFDPDLRNTISNEVNRTTPEPALQRRRDLLLQALGSAPGAADDIASSGWARNTEFPTLWTRFRRAVINAQAETARTQQRLKISRILPLAQLIQVNLSQAMTPAMTLQAQGLTSEVRRRLNTLSNQDLLDTLGAENWQDAVVTLTKGTRREFSSSQILTAGTVMDAVTAGLNWIMLPRDKKAAGDAIDALTDAMITLDALTDSSGAYGSVTPMSMLDAANQ